ncbi:unnamed protein product [Eruca vesicaria subsp. sativa]|uniref:Uncharacterized protein n=1 Tax=Eruca vesicaria subsp. sativa TaxID=29727 RepID=A0ABC8KUI6_ERUVS|nr:unnamed protein product [Eruca vesicaria subsp. sativa]
MKTGLTILQLSFCLSLIVVVSLSMGMRPETCDQYECPTYEMPEAGNGYEICVYKSAVWMSTGSIPAPSMTEASKTGFQW